jgi:hypothetical protein
MSEESTSLPTGLSDEKLRHALRDIVGDKKPKHLTMEFEKPGVSDADPQWEGNVYKYSF